MTEWSFGVLPELMEIKRKNHSVIGYPALIDQTTHCTLDVFDEIHTATLAHHHGLRRLFRIALRDQVKFLEKNLHELTKLGMMYLPLGTQEKLRDQVINCALDRACLQEPWPVNAEEFESRKQEGRIKLGLLAQEVARLAGTVLEGWSAVMRKLPQAKPHQATYADLQFQMSQLMRPDFIDRIPYAQLGHLPRYMKAAIARMDKLRADPARDARLMIEMAPLLTQYARARSALKGAPDAGLDAFRWMLEELRVALFAQELRTPMPVSVKRLQKAWEAMQR
jgi:ATP-dependent helicase HrpA